MWFRDENLLKMVLEVEFVWTVALKLSRQNAQNVTILKNDSYVSPIYKKLPFLFMGNISKVGFLRSTLTISSTFPQFPSKMSLLGNQIRN